jgi:hypothetical protein
VLWVHEAAGSNPASPTRRILTDLPNPDLGEGPTWVKAQPG